VFRICIVLAALAACLTARAERAVLECIADTWVAGGDRTAHGREHTLILSKNGAAALLFRVAAVEGWQLKNVVLLLHLSGGTAPERIRVGPLKASWSESSATWNTISRAKARWRRVRTFDENWIAIDLDPGEALGHGIILSGGEARFHSRETVGFAPYLLVEGSAPPR